MIDISVNELGKFYGAYKVFEKINMEIKTKDRIGLVGENGVGKTSLFKVLIGEEDYHEGAVHYRKNITLGYLKQQYEHDENETVKQVLLSAFEQVLQMEEKMKAITSQLESDLDDDTREKLLIAYGELQNDFEQQGGYDIDYKVNEVIQGLQISEAMQRQPFNQLSGGEKSSVVLGKILLLNPDVLLLDEPSNHLDIESMNWLEEYLKTYEGSALIISHDRYFLDHVATKIIEMKKDEAELFLGNYSYYVEERQRRFEQAMKIYEQQQKKINRMEEQIKRFRIWGAMRDSEKMYAKAKELEKRLDKIDKLEKPKEDKEKKLNFEGNRTAKEVMVIDHLSMAFDQKVLFTDFSAKIFYQDRVGFIGRNGSGKSTLIKILMNEVDPISGSSKIGSRVKAGYLPQEVFFKNDEETVLDYYGDYFGISQSEARGILARYYFYSSDVNKKLKSLSGGEKSRLKLAVLMNEKPNFLILDEPTNHLDLTSREALEANLLEFKGTIFFISHDRYFINKIASRLFELEHQSVKIYEGNYEYYKIEKEKSQKTTKEVNDKNQKITTETKEKNLKNSPDIKKINSQMDDVDQKSSYFQRKEAQKLQRQKENKIKKLEEEIEKLENRKIELENQQLEFSNDYVKLQEITETIKKIDELLLNHLKDWENCNNS